MAEPLLLLNPSLSRDQIAFRHADDIWTVSRNGGEAERLTSSASVIAGPFFSPDGYTLAYSARVNGNIDVYTIPANGGVPHRITYHPGPDIIAGWTPDGRELLFLSGRTSWNDFDKLYHIRADGSGLPTEYALPSADSGSLSPDGKQIAYTPFNQWQKAWKRYRGGQTEPVWIVDLASLDLTKVPRENSNDSNPMWMGDKVYFLSDRNGPVTLFSYDTKSKQVQQLVENKGFDLKSASAGPGGIVYEQFGSIHLYDIAANAEHVVDITLRGELPALEPHLAIIDPHAILNAEISPTGQRAVFEARGDIFTVPAEKGDTRNLTNTSNAAERDPSWSPDGKTIAYFSDASGEYQLFLRAQNGLAAPKVIDLGPGASFFYSPRWSPDSKRLLYGDKKLNLWYVDIESGHPVKIDTDNYEGFGNAANAHWSPDGKWVAYLKTLHNFMHAIYLYSLDTQKSTQITDGMSDVGDLAFDRNGKYLYFIASTNIGPSVDGFDLSSLDRAATSSAYVVVLSKDLPSPIPPESDDENAKKDEAKDKDKDKDKDQKPAAGDEAKKPDEKSGSKDEAKKEEPKLPTVKIDFDGIDQRILALPIPPRNYIAIATGKEGVLYLAEGSPFANPSHGDGAGIRSLWRFNLEKRDTDEVLRNVDAFTVSFNGEKLLYKKGEAWLIAGADELKPGATDASAGKPLNLGGMQATEDPRAEWRQMYHETWRIERDFFYDPGHHGLDLAKAEARYRPWLDGIGSRDELDYLFEEMLGEITVGHMFVRGPNEPDHSPHTGLLGADYSLENGRYRFARIYNGENWNPSLHAPLTQPGVNVKEGEYLLAVNGRDLRATDNLYSFFEGTAGKQVVLHVGQNADGSGGRDVTVVTVESEHGLRNLAFIEANRRKVDAMTHSQVAYVYMPNTGGGGFISFNRYFYAQVDKKAVIIDERYNEGGQIADSVIDTLRRVPMSNYETREGDPVTDPAGAIFGPKAMLINQSAGSGGDLMPWYFRKAGLGPLIGERTWGGLVGIGGYPVLLDGGRITAPRTALYGLTGSFEVENHGITPDIEVEYDPKSVAAGHDPQLDRAVEYVTGQLKEHPLPIYPKPPYPDYHQHDGLGTH
ncbi:PDZ domain-containing protein [Acidipila sp. 4G-K13]|uniref:Tricorn protease homolog n=2 Tax=Paracidobacterium acidisoli TaxID=2303751 RepID=A0A372IP92_9BACT|nr:S41 family peptidase [Paracidobacterium acidisoli]MBT9331911.1 PDZ domain-containing protein [Paracidobacterium acidisoli]